VEADGQRPETPAKAVPLAARRSPRRQCAPGDEARHNRRLRPRWWPLPPVRAFVPSGC